MKKTMRTAIPSLLLALAGCACLDEVPVEAESPAAPCPTAEAVPEKPVEKAPEQPSVSGAKKLVAFGFLPDLDVLKSLSARYAVVLVIKGEPRKVAAELNGHPVNSVVGNGPSFDKYRMLMNHVRRRGFAAEDVVFVGDDFGEGGLDESVRQGGLDCLVVDDPDRLADCLSVLLK